MTKDEWQAEENKYLVTIDQLAEQENWAKANCLPLLAKAYGEGQRIILIELGLLQKLRAKQ